MSRIELRIGADGCVRGLWTDEINWRALGRLFVCRASHVEFCDRQQCWLVRAAEPASLLRRWLQRLLGQPSGRVLHRAATRTAALAWEHEYFRPGGTGWPAHNERRSRR